MSDGKKESIQKEGVSDAIIPDCGPLPRSNEHSWKAKSDTALQVNRTVYEAYYPRCIGWHPKQEPSFTASGMVKT